MYFVYLNRQFVYFPSRRGPHRGGASSVRKQIPCLCALSFKTSRKRLGVRARSDTASSRSQAERHPEIMPAHRRLPEMPESQQRRREIGVTLSRRARPLPPALPTTMLKHHLGITPEYPSAERSGKAVQGQNLAPPSTLEAVLVCWRARRRPAGRARGNARAVLRSVHCGCLRVMFEVRGSYMK